MLLGSPRRACALTTRVGRMQTSNAAPAAESPSPPAAPPPPLDSSARPPVPPPELQGLSDFRASEGTANRRSKLRSLFDSIPIPGPTSDESEVQAKDDEKSREENRKIYARELWGKCSGDSCGVGTSTVVADSELQWPAFKRYAEEKEHELWRLFVELNVDGNMRLRKEEVKEACKRAGIEVDRKVLDDFFKELDRNGEGFIEFGEWRDFLLVSSRGLERRTQLTPLQLLPRRASISEILMYYQTHRLKRPSMSQLTQDGDGESHFPSPVDVRSQLPRSRRRTRQDWLEQAPGQARSHQGEQDGRGNQLARKGQERRAALGRAGRVRGAQGQRQRARGGRGRRAGGASARGSDSRNVCWSGQVLTRRWSCRRR